MVSFNLVRKCLNKFSVEEFEQTTLSLFKESDILRFYVNQSAENAIKFKLI